MTCHRDGARHCSCPPEAAEAASALLLTSADPAAHAALVALAAPLGALVEELDASTTRVVGDVAALLAAAAPHPSVDLFADAPVLPLAALAAGVRPAPEVALPRRGELLASLERELEHQRPGTTTALLFCSLGAEGAHSGPVFAAAAARVRTRLRRSDLLADCGEGRLVALLPSLPLPQGEDAAERVVMAVRDALREPVTTPAGLFPLSPVVGVLVHPGNPADDDAELAVDVEPFSAGEMLAVVERALERGSLPSAGPSA